MHSCPLACPLDKALLPCQLQELRFHLRAWCTCSCPSMSYLPPLSGWFASPGRSESLTFVTCVAIPISCCFAAFPCSIFCSRNFGALPTGGSVRPWCGSARPPNATASQIMSWRQHSRCTCQRCGTTGMRESAAVHMVNALIVIPQRVRPHNCLDYKATGPHLQLQLHAMITVHFLLYTTQLTFLHSIRKHRYAAK